MKSGANRRHNDANLSNILTTLTTSWSNRSLSQSGCKVDQGNGSPEVNPCNVYNPFDILIEEGLVDDLVGSNDTNTVSISCLGCENHGEFTPTNTGEAESDRLVYAKSRDVTASGSTQTGLGHQSGVADEDAGKSKKNRYLHHSELKYNVGEVKEGLGHSSD